MISKGKTVRWYTPGVKYARAKIGTVIDIIEPNQSAYDSIPFVDNVSEKCRHFQEFSKCDRVLVEVEQGTKNIVKHYYCPKLQVLEAQGN